MDLVVPSFIARKKMQLTINRANRFYKEQSHNITHIYIYKCSFDVFLSSIMQFLF